MDIFSSFATNELVFGKYPTQEEVDLIQNQGFGYILNLCEDHEIEKKGKYQLKETTEYVHYPIVDCKAPNSNTFYPIAKDVIEYLKKSVHNKVYVHCRGGHGRSATVVAAILMLKYGVTAEEAIDTVWSAHQKRIDMKPALRILGAPQTDVQKNWLRSRNGMKYYG